MALNVPDYGGACLSGLLPAILGQRQATWLPEELAGAERVVLLVLDGLGYEQLAERSSLAPVLWGMRSTPISSVAPTTTATALTSITTGCTPAEHGIVGYRIAVGGGEVLNVLRWRAGERDARGELPPAQFQPRPPFLGREVPVVTRAEFAGTGFSDAHLRGGRLLGWRVPSSIAVDVARAAASGAEFVYAYYDGIDKVAHERGLGEHFEAELSFADRIVGEILDRLPAGTALAVTSDHGQIDVGESVITLDAAIMAESVEMLSGEGRFRWLHARPGRTEVLVQALEEAYGGVAWVRTREELEKEGVLGGPLSPGVAARLGDVALLARAPVAFSDPADTGELRLVSRHGSLTSEEIRVPLCVALA